MQDKKDAKNPDYYDKRGGIGVVKRTVQQNKSLHKWLELLAEALNDSGQSMGDGLVIRLPIRYSKDRMKDLIVKPYIKEHYFDANGNPKESTTQLTTLETQDLYRNLDHIIAELSGVHVEWPSEESRAEENV